MDFGAPVLNRFLTYIAISFCLAALSTAATASCMPVSSKTPKIPDPQTATYEQMLIARLAVNKYVRQAERYANCSKNHSDKRAERALKRATRLAKRYNKVSKVYIASREQSEEYQRIQALVSN